MIAGLLFAVHDADDGRGGLAATLPFAGMTVIEYQARLAIAAGASQLVLVVARMTPELLGAVARIGRRGVAVDTVRSAGEAGARIHPLSHLLVLADGLVTTDAVLQPFAREAADALLVVPEGEVGGDEYELIGGGDAWAGIARLEGRRLAEVAAMPRDYDVQSALIHVAAQAGSVRLVLPDDERRAGHGIERRREPLEARSRAVINATLASRPGWFDRWLVAPLARIVLPALMRRHVPTTALAGVSGLIGVLGLAGVWAGQLVAGLLVCIVGIALGSLAAGFAWIRDEPGTVRLMKGMAIGVPALAALLVALAVDQQSGERTALAVAVALIVASGLVERAVTQERATGWADPPAALVVVTAGTMIGTPFWGLMAAAVYATATLALAIERLRVRV